MNLTLPAEVELQSGTLEFLQSFPKKLLVDGEWVEAHDRATFPTFNPATGEELGQVALAGPEDVSRAVQAARAAFETGPWGKMTGEERGNLLWNLADLIDQHADELAEIENSR